MTTAPTLLDQQYLGGGDRLPMGDCYRTSLAALLGLDDPRKVPHFVQLTSLHLDTFSRTAGGWHDDFWTRDWLRSIGYVDLAEFHLDDLQAWAIHEDLDTLPCLACVPSRAYPGLNHSIVWDAVRDQTLVDPASRNRTRRPYARDEIKDGFAQALCKPYDPDPLTQLEERRDRGRFTPHEVYLLLDPPEIGAMIEAEAGQPLPLYDL